MLYISLCLSLKLSLVFCIVFSFLRIAVRGSSFRVQKENYNDDDEEWIQFSFCFPLNVLCGCVCAIYMLVRFGAILTQFSSFLLLVVVRVCQCFICGRWLCCYCCCQVIILVSLIGWFVEIVVCLHSKKS